MSQAAEFQQAAEEFRFVVALEVVLLAVIALLLWPLGELRLALSLAKGLGLLYAGTWVVFLLMVFVHRALRIDAETRFDAFVLSNFAVSASLLVGWSAFAALAARAAAAGEPQWRAAVVWLVGVFSVHMAYTVVSAWYSGTFYRYKNLPIAAAAFVVFAAWPAAARFLFGWLFHLW
jgi:hypothetical protein